MTREDLIGVWRIEVEEAVTADGDVSYPFGRDRMGTLIYSDEGYMSVVATGVSRSLIPDKCAKMDIDDATMEERAAAAHGCVAYSGRFTLEGTTVSHTIEISLNPNMVGQSRTRRIALSGDQLILSMPADASGTFGRIVWRRVR